MPFDMVLLTSAVIMVMSVFGTFTMYYYFRRLGEKANRSNLFWLGVSIGAILIAAFILWLSGQTYP